MLSHLEGVRLAETTEPIHQIRVWSRRTLSALAVCRTCDGSESLIGVQREVKAVIDALGDACDLDMILEAIGRRAKKLAPLERQGAEALLDHFSGRRLALQGQILAAAQRLERKNLLCRFDEAVAVPTSPLDEETLPGRRMRHGVNQWLHGLEKPVSIFAHASRILGRRIDAVLSFESCLSCPQSVDDLHRMRLALKRLRYTMELFEEVYRDYSDHGDEFLSTLSSLEALQNRLGKIHDADVLVLRVSRCVAAMLKDGYSGDRRETPAAGAGPIDLSGCLTLLAICREVEVERDRDYHRFVLEWRLRDERLFNRLRDLLRAAAVEESAADCARAS